MSKTANLQPRRGRWLRADYWRYSVYIHKGDWVVYDWTAKEIIARFPDDGTRDARTILRWPEQLDEAHLVPLRKEG